MRLSLRTKNDNGSNVEGSFWLDDHDWHYYTVTFTETAAKVYIDGVLANAWTLDNTSDGQKMTNLFTKGSLYTHICLGGNQRWDATSTFDYDPAFKFDDIAIYDAALSAEQIAQIMSDKKPEESVTLPSNGYATFASPYALDLANLPSGLTAYKASVSGTTVTFTQVTEAVAANTGLLLQGDAESSPYSIPLAASGADISASNAFLVNTGSIEVDNNYYYFGLVKNSLTFGLFDPSTVTIPSNKAYLKVLKTSIDSPSGARTLNVVFGDEATGISTVETSSKMNGKAYNLSGQRVAAPQKGLYIVNGKKVIVK